MEDKIRDAINYDIGLLGFTVDSVSYLNKTLYIVLDSVKLIDSDMITAATKVISPILDKYDFIKENYVLDVSSKEKEGNLK